MLRDWLTCPVCRGTGAVRIATPLLLQTALAWTDPKFTVLRVSSLTEERNHSSHPSVPDEENTCSVQNISGSFTALTPTQKKATEKKNKIFL